MKKASTVSRVLSGSAASWVGIGVNLVVQLLGIPIYLSHWTVSQYGAWIAFITLTAFVQIIDIGHQTYLQNEFLRIGKGRKRRLELVFSSSLLIALMVGLIEFILVMVLCNSAAINTVVGRCASLDIQDIKWLLIAHYGMWVIFGSIGGIFTRMLAAYGFYSRYAWWNTGLQAVVAIVPIVAILSGAGILATGLTMLAANCLVNLFLWFDILVVFRQSRISYRYPSLALGWSNFRLSLAICFKTILEMLRQQGVRLVLAPLSNITDLAAFVTMRTGANVAMQGLGTITNPLKPETMNYLNAGDQDRLDSTLGLVWITIAAVFSPAVLVLQVVFPGLFVVWTRGKIQFEPVLFALLSLSVLVFGLAQPAMSIVQGVNQLGPQIVLSLGSGILVFTGMFYFVPHCGIVAVGWALLAGEIVSLIGYTRAADNVLREKQLRWPHRAFRWVALSVLVSGASMLLISFLPALSKVTFPVTMMLLMFLGFGFWRQLPQILRSKIICLLHLK